MDLISIPIIFSYNFQIQYPLDLHLLMTIRKTFVIKQFVNLYFHSITSFYFISLIPNQFNSKYFLKKYPKLT